MAKKSFSVEIREDFCKGCGICIVLCPQGVLAAEPDGTAKVVAQEKCIGCDSCVIHCPDFCYEVKELKND